MAATQDSQQAIADYLLSYTDNKNSFVVRADSGMDELDPLSTNNILAVNGSALEERVLPASLDKQMANNFSSLAQDHARLFKEMIGDFSSAPIYLRSLITLNAGAAFCYPAKSRIWKADQNFSGRSFAVRRSFS